MTTVAKFLLILLMQFNFVIGEEYTGTLRAVQVLMRHGDREPDKSITNQGGLINEGKQQMFQLGKYLRVRYRNLIQENFDSRETQFLSTDFDRCINSAYLVGRGFYHLYNTAARWGVDNNVKFEPISVQVIPKAADKYLQLSHPCPKYDLFEETNRNFLNDLVSRNEKLITKMVKETGNDAILNDSWAAIYRGSTVIGAVESVIRNISLNLPIPDWGLEALANEDLRYYTYNLFALSVSTPEKQMFLNGPFVKLVLDTFEDRMTKVVFYLGHDRNMFTLMKSLGIWDDDDYTLPPTGTALMFELHEKLIEGATYQYIELWYRNNTAVLPKMLEIPNCRSPCDLIEFRQHFKNLIPENYEVQCDLDLSPRNL